MSYIEIIKSNVTKRLEQVRELERWLLQNTDWGMAPASTKLEYHSAHPKGLIAHSVLVTETLLKLKKELASGISDESCVIVGMYHDCGKAGADGVPYYIPQNSQWHREKLGQMYLVNQQLTHIDIATRSLIYVSKFVELTDEEAQAIRYHDGQYVDDNRSVAHKEAELTRLLQYADNWASGVLEKTNMGR